VIRTFGLVYCLAMPLSAREQHLSEMAERLVRRAIDALAEAQRIVTDEATSRESIAKALGASLAAEEDIRCDRDPNRRKA
jgi:2-methylcitrate dehydratase PrpD